MGRMFAGIAFAVISFVVFFNLASDATGPGGKALKEMAVSEILDGLAKAANDRQGKKVAWNVVVLGAEVEDGRRLTYNYKITNAQSDRFDEEKAAPILEKLQKKACEDRVVRQAMKRGGEVTYSYVNKKDNHLFSVGVDEVICHGLS